MVNVSIKCEPGDSVDFMLRKFKSAVAKAGVLADYRNKSSFVPKTQRRKSKRARAQIRQINGARKAMERFGYRKGGSF